MNKIWKIKELNPQAQAVLSGALNIAPIAALVLINRGITELEDARRFLRADLLNLHDPFLLKNMRLVVDRILKARDKKERVLIFGDYDVDGVTSSVILTQALKRLGIEVVNHIPHRVKDGYGLNSQVVEIARSNQINLVITVDCGISAVQEVEALSKRGIDVIIIDHHEPNEILPLAYAIINPKQADCPYPFKDLASVGLTAKLLQALLQKIPEEFLDLICIGTIADVVPLRGENRILVKAGLPKILKTQNKGLSAILDAAKLKSKAITPYAVGFIIGPRLNAAGRMDTAHRALDLLLTEDEIEARQLAEELEGHNADRQKMQREVVEEALMIVEQEINFKEHKVIVLSKNGWHKGVLGIAASRITEKFYRPSIVISLKDGVGTASARSIDGFHLTEALQNCHPYLENFGGHAGAAGLTIKEENIDPFRSLINEVADKVLLNHSLTPMLDIDADLALREVNLELAEMMKSLEPFGEGNDVPLFCSKGLVIKGPVQTFAKETLKLWLTDGKVTISAVGFGMAKYKDMLLGAKTVDVAYELAIDDWNKLPSAQLRLRDIRE